MTLIAAALNGVCIAIGMMIGTRLTGDVVEKKLKKILDESPTAKSLKKFVGTADKMLVEGRVNSLITTVTKFFEEATMLVSSPEAKNFFKNVTELMKEFSTSGEDKRVEFKMPKRRRVKKS